MLSYSFRRRVRGVLAAPWVVLEPLWDLSKPCGHHLDATRVPKWSPKGSQIEFQKQLDRKIVKPQTLHTVRRNSMMFLVSGLFCVGNAFETLHKNLGRYHSGLEAILFALGRVLSVIRSPKGVARISDPPTSPRKQPEGRGWGGANPSPGIGGEWDNFRLLHALRHRGFGR